jgi:hypothetical protein
MQTAVLPVRLGLFRYLPWTAVAHHMPQGLSSISTTLRKSRWKRCRTNFNEVGARPCASVLFNQNACACDRLEENDRPLSRDLAEILNRKSFSDTSRRRDNFIANLSQETQNEEEEKIPICK